MREINKIKLKINSTIKDALQIIDSGAIQIALVVDENDKLIGTLTDGDIRRAFLKGFSLDNSIENIIFRNPTTATIDESKEDVLKKALKKKLYQIPIVDEFGKLIDIKEIDELVKPKIKTNQVILMVGGLGSRLKPLTTKTPKPMLKVGNKPILQTIIEKFAEYGYLDIVLCVNYRSDLIQDYFGDGSEFGVNIEYVCEKKRMGTAGALSLLKTTPKEPFFVMNGDLLTNVNFEHLFDFHIANDSMGTMCVREYDFQVPYGVVNINKNKIVSIEEKPIQKFFVSAGIYMLNPQVLDLVPKDTFYDMPDFFNKLIQNNHNVVSFPIREYWLDIGHIDEYKRANKEYNEVF